MASPVTVTKRLVNQNPKKVKQVAAQLSGLMDASADKMSKEERKRAQRECKKIMTSVRGS